MNAAHHIIVAAISGAVLCCVATAFILYAIFASGGYTRESLIELPPWGFPVLGLLGALLGGVFAIAFGRIRLPRTLGYLARGAGYGVAVVVSVTLLIASVRGAATSKGQAPYLQFGLLYGVPVGIVLGGLVASIVNIKWPARQS